MRDMLLSFWTNFAAYGDPSPPGSGFNWQPQKPDSEHVFWYMSSLDPKMSTTPGIQDRWELWNNILG